MNGLRIKTKPNNRINIRTVIGGIILGLVVITVLSFFNKDHAFDEEKDDLKDSIAVSESALEQPIKEIEILADELMKELPPAETDTSESNSDLTKENDNLAEQESESEMVGADYFANYRIERTKVREESKKMLSPMLSSTIESVRKEAERKWLELNEKNQKEDELESLLKIKGFEENIVNINGDKVTVIVLAKELSPNEVSMIQDTVVKICNTRLDNIIIMPKY